MFVFVPGAGGQARLLNWFSLAINLTQIGILGTRFQSGVLCIVQTNTTVPPLPELHTDWYFWCKGGCKTKPCLASLMTTWCGVESEGLF